MSWDEKAERLFGYSPREVLGKPITLLFPEEGLKEQEALAACLVRGERVIEFETRCLAKDGRFIDISVTLSPIHDDHGNVFAVSKAVRDISRQCPLQLENAFYWALLRDTEDAVFSQTLDGVVATWNRAAERLFGYSATEIIGHPVAKLFKASFGDLAILLSTPNTAEGHVFEARCVRKNGTPIKIAITASPIRNDQGELIAISAIARDAQHQSRTQVQQLLAASIIENSDDAIISKTPDGIVLTWNRGAERIFGYTPEEMIGTSITRLFPPDRLHEERDFLERIRAGETISRFETLRIGKSGKKIHVAVTLSAIRDGEGEIIGLSKIARDISEQVSLRQAAQGMHDDLQHIVDQCPYKIGLWNGDGTSRLANAAYAASFGLTPPQMHGRHVAEIIGRDQYPKIKPVMAAVAGGQAVNFERVSRLTDGGVRHESVCVVPDLRSTPPGLSVYINDVTQRRNAEKSAAHNAARYRNLYERAPAMLASIERDGRVLAVSDLWVQCLGYLREEILGRSLFDLMTPESRRKAQEIDFAAFRVTGRLSESELQFVCGTGERMDVLLSAVPESEDPGAHERIIVVLQDVTAVKRARLGERQSKDLLDRAGRLASVGGWALDVRTQGVDWSDEIRRIFEVPASYSPTLDMSMSFFSRESRDQIRDAMDRCIREQTPYVLELQVTTAGGRKRWVRIAGEAEAGGGTVTRIVGAFQDITERKLAELEVAAQHERLRVTLASIADAVITTDRRGVIEWLNPVASQLTGWDLDAARGLHVDEIFRIIDEETRLSAASPVTRAALEGCAVGLPEQTVLVSRGGREIAIDDSAAPIRDSSGAIVGIVLVFHDVSEQRRLSREITFRAAHDALTGLFNRSAFEAKLGRLFESSRQGEQCHVLMYLDLDQFKIVNDTCGHTAGDRLLREVSALFQSVVRTRDTLARLGGDEFGILLESCSLAQARRVAEQIGARMQDFWFIQDDRRFKIGASIGVVPIDSRWTSQAEVLQAADAACYSAKEAGRNRVHEWREADEGVRMRQGQMRWATEIPLALEENRFRLYGQRIEPCASSSAGLHLEVLIRMYDGSGELVCPAAFLPAAERFNLVTRLDRWVLRQVVLWMQDQDLGAIDTVAVNLSGQSIGDRSFHQFVAELVSGAAFDPKKLCFEITETAAITNIVDAQEFIATARRLGVRIALDDFGAGASSFGYLKNLQLDFLKIDGQFIRRIREDALDRTAVCAFRDVAHVCNVRTIAEFVESEEVMATLKEIGIDLAQGSLFHRPEPLQTILGSARSSLPPSIHPLAPASRAEGATGNHAPT